MTKEIQLAVGKMQVLKYHNPVCENIGALSFDIEMDVFSISTSGLLYEFEVKISKSDFKADAKKKKWIKYNIPDIHSTPNYFSYACPKDIISLDSIPKYAGPYYFHKGELTEVRKPKRIHNSKPIQKTIYIKVNRISAERNFLGCARMTYENNKHK